MQRTLVLFTDCCLSSAHETKISSIRRPKISDCMALVMPLPLALFPWRHFLSWNSYTGHIFCILWIGFSAVWCNALWILLQMPRITLEMLLCQWHQGFYVMQYSMSKLTGTTAVQTLTIFMEAVPRATKMSNANSSFSEIIYAWLNWIFDDNAYTCTIRLRYTEMECRYVN